MNILFVCTGNTCRSPMAEVLLRKKGPGLQVKSAGIFATDGAPASQQARTVMEARGIAMDHQSQTVSPELLQWAQLVLTMTDHHRQLLVAQYPQFSDKIIPLREYAEGQPGDIADPFGGDLGTYEATALELEAEIDRILDSLHAEEEKAE